MRLQAPQGERMKEIKPVKPCGFTLIELLVVVLIIAILAAIALPQYQKSVYKSHIAGVMPLVRSIKTAQEAYYLYHGSYAPYFKDLDVTLPSSCRIYNGNQNIVFCDDWLFDNQLVYNVAQGRLSASFCPEISRGNYNDCNNNSTLSVITYYRYSTRHASRADTISCVGANASATGACKSFKGKFF